MTSPPYNPDNPFDDRNELQDVEHEQSARECALLWNNQPLLKEAIELSKEKFGFDAWGRLAYIDRIHYLATGVSFSVGAESRDLQSRFLTS